MILIMTTSLVINDALVVEHEGAALGVDADAGWLLGDGCLQLGNTLLWNFVVGLDADFTHGFGSLASLVLALVRIVGLKRDLVILSVLEGPDFETAVATRVARLGVIAINEMLLRKLKELTSLNGV